MTTPGLPTTTPISNPSAPPTQRDYGKVVPTPGRIVRYLHGDEELPMIIVKVYPDGDVSGQVFLNGNEGLLYIQSTFQGTKPGQWDWFPRV